MKARLPKEYNMSQGDMLKQVQKMQEEMANKQAEIEETIFEASSGGGVVTVEVTGKKEVKSIKLKEEIVDPDDIEMLEDLIVAAVNEAIKKAEDAMSDAMGKLTGGLPNIPGLF